MFIQFQQACLMVNPRHLGEGLCSERVYGGAHKLTHRTAGKHSLLAFETGINKKTDSRCQQKGWEQ